MSLNMKKEIRAEIRLLTKAKHKVCRDFDRSIRDNIKEIGRHERAIARLTKNDSRLACLGVKATNKIQNRILILQGRLS